MAATRDGSRPPGPPIPATTSSCTAATCAPWTTSEAFIDATVERFGRIDGLVNNAGQSRMKPLADVDWSDWTDELDLKFASVLHPLQAALPHLRRSPAAAVVNINAVLARQPETHLITTSAARAGVLNLSKNLATELASDRIRVNSVLLGLIESGQWHRRHEAAETDLDWDDWSAELARSRGIPMGRVGTPRRSGGGGGVPAVAAGRLRDRIDDRRRRRSRPLCLTRGSLRTGSPTPGRTRSPPTPAPPWSTWRPPTARPPCSAW